MQAGILLSHSNDPVRADDESALVYGFRFDF